MTLFSRSLLAVVLCFAGLPGGVIHPAGPHGAYDLDDYDAGANGLGRRTSMADGSGTTT